jgi:putative tricarboxylic transport membrane protein
VKAWRTLRAADLALSAILMLSGVAALVSVRQMRVGFASEFRPRLFPTIVGVLLIMTGVLLAVTAWRTRADAIAEWPTTDRAKRIVVMLASVAAYIVCIDLLGMPLATFAVMAFEVWYLGDYPWYVPVVVGLVSATVLYLVFMLGLGLTFPVGPFER